MLSIEQKDIMKDIQALFKSVFDIDKYNAWLSKMNLVFMNETEIQFSVSTNFIKEYIMSNFYTNIKQLLRTHYNILIVEIVILKKDDSNVVSISPNGNLYNIGIELKKEYVFENFVVGKSNELAYNVAQKVVDGDKTLNPFFVYGNVGLGKTHLLQSICWKLKEKYKKQNIVYLTAEKFMSLYVNSLLNDSTNNFKEQIKNIDVLVIDDIQFLVGKEGTQREFFFTFNTLINENKTIVLACDKAPNDLQKMDETLKSRIQSGMIVDITEPDYRLKVEITRKKVEIYDLKCNDNIFEIIAGKQNTIRDIDGLIKKLAFEQKILQKEPDLRAIGNILNEKKTIISCGLIQEKVVEYFKITKDELLGNKRSEKFILPRHIAFYLARKLTKKSYPDLATEFNKNHATILNGYKKIENEIANGNYEVINIINIIKI
ncbi:MAG: chromosomal replication initiator protein DnaA [Rickettsiales bacterium]|jgi:chromosomal replication initiator protein|nr:chromosomal replication initiator protein DnaA [Rickettsiales bacterium]